MALNPNCSREWPTLHSQKFHRLHPQPHPALPATPPPHLPAGVSHGCAVGELLVRLAVNGDGHTGIGVKGELHAVLYPGLSTVLSGALCILFVPMGPEPSHCQSISNLVFLTGTQPTGYCKQLPGWRDFRCCDTEQEVKLEAAILPSLVHSLPPSVSSHSCGQAHGAQQHDCEPRRRDTHLTRRRESFRMFTRLLRVFTGSWGAGVTYGN